MKNTKLSTLHENAIKEAKANFANAIILAQKARERLQEAKAKQNGNIYGLKPFTLDETITANTSRELCARLYITAVSRVSLAYKIRMEHGRGAVGEYFRRLYAEIGYIYLFIKPDGTLPNDFEGGDKEVISDDIQTSVLSLWKEKRFASVKANIAQYTQEASKEAVYSVGREHDRQNGKNGERFNGKIDKDITDIFTACAPLDLPNDLPPYMAKVCRAVIKTKDDLIIFDGIASGRTLASVADDLGVSKATAQRKTKAIIERIASANGEHFERIAKHKRLLDIE